MKFKIPTDGEIEIAYHEVEPDDNNWDLCTAYGDLAVHNPILRKRVMGIVETAMAFVKQGIPIEFALQAAAGGAMGFGLNLGIHISQRPPEKAKIQ